MKKYKVQFGRGVAAGLVATTLLSLVIVLDQVLGVLPQLSTISVFARMFGYQSMAAGWALHLFVGVFAWGPLYAWIDPRSTYPHWFVGMMFGSAIWLGVMLLVMPAIGAGLFGIRLGLAAPTVTLLLHWIYGTALGAVFGSGKLWNHAHWHLRTPRAVG